MSNIDEVKNHLLQLIPRFIIRIYTDMKFNANYDPNSRIMFLNEKMLFKLKNIYLTQIFKIDKLSYSYWNIAWTLWT